MIAVTVATVALVMSPQGSAGRPADPVPPRSWIEYPMFSASLIPRLPKRRTFTATVTCTVIERGYLDDCTFVDGTPEGAAFGVGENAARAARSAQVRLGEGHQVGDRVTFTMSARLR